MEQSQEGVETGIGGGGEFGGEGGRQNGVETEGAEHVGASVTLEIAEKGVKGLKRDYKRCGGERGRVDGGWVGKP